VEKQIEVVQAKRNSQTSVKANQGFMNVPKHSAYDQKPM